MWRSEDNLQELVLVLYCVGSGDWSWVVRLGDRFFYQMSYSPNPSSISQMSLVVPQVFLGFTGTTKCSQMYLIPKESSGLFTTLVEATLHTAQSGFL